MIKFLTEAPQREFLSKEGALYVSEYLGLVYAKAKVAVGVRHVYHDGTKEGFRYVVFPYNGKTYVATTPSNRMRAFGIGAVIRECWSVGSQVFADGNSQQALVSVVESALLDGKKFVIVRGSDRNFRFQTNGELLPPKDPDRYVGVSIWSNETKSNDRRLFDRPVTKEELREGRFDSGGSVGGLKLTMKERRFYTLIDEG